MRLSCLGETMAATMKETGGRQFAHKRKQTNTFFTTTFYDVAAGTAQQAALFYFKRHCYEMSDKHRDNILTLKMQSLSRWECWETSPAGFFRQEAEGKNHIVDHFYTTQHSHLFFFFFSFLAKRAFTNVDEVTSDCPGCSGSGRKAPESCSPGRGVGCIAHDSCQKCICMWSRCTLWHSPSPPYWLLVDSGALGPAYTPTGTWWMVILQQLGWFQNT